MTFPTGDNMPFPKPAGRMMAQMWQAFTITNLSDDVPGRGLEPKITKEELIDQMNKKLSVIPVSILIFRSRSWITWKKLYPV